MSATPAIALDPGANYEAAEVAIWLRVSLRSFARRRRKMQAEGFPRPISRWGKKVWSGQALIDWQNRPQEILPLGDNVLPIHQHLAARAALAAAQGARRNR